MKSAASKATLKARLARYPKNWKEISAKIRERSKTIDAPDGRCECMGECGLHPWGRCVERQGQKAHFARGKIVLTVMHMNHVEADCRDENLRAACQRCHLRYDAPHHAETARATREASNPTPRML